MSVRQSIGLFKITSSVERVAQAMVQDRDFHKVGSLNTHVTVHVVLLPAARLEEFTNLVSDYLASIRGQS